MTEFTKFQTKILKVQPRGKHKPTTTLIDSINLFGYLFPPHVTYINATFAYMWGNAKYAAEMVHNHQTVDKWFNTRPNSCMQKMAWETTVAITFCNGGRKGSQSYRRRFFHAKRPRHCCYKASNSWINIWRTSHTLSIYLWGRKIEECGCFNFFHLSTSLV